MNSEQVQKLLHGKAVSFNVKNCELTNVEWKTQVSNSKSILFYKINPDGEPKFLEQMEKASYGLLIINSAEAKIEHLSNVLVVAPEDWLECQKILMDELYPFPFSKVKLVGITGTNGKTTTTDLTRQMALGEGKKVLTIGTLGVKKNQEQVIPEGLTTPPYIELRKILYEHARDVDVVIMEVSSHSLVQERVYGLKYDAVAWTSFSQDHLDFHANLDEYFQAKTLLLKKHLKAGAPCFVPVYEEALFLSLKGLPGVTKTTSLNERKAVNLPLFFKSHFNQSNLEVAWNLCEHLWQKKVSPNVDSYKMTEGRFSIFAHEDKKIIIDFAHTPDAIKNICLAARSAFPQAGLHLVFGCGGNRDKGKRPLMGQMAETHADFVYVTSDNPRFEKPEEIIQDIVVGMQGKNHEVVTKREDAIAVAFKKLKSHDVLIIAGKGHENYQIIGDVKHEYTDFAVVDKLMKGKNHG